MGLALDRFEIGAFRGLKDVRFDRLARLNLLVGGNNTGKTSVLEALYIFCKPLNVHEWANVATQRNQPIPSFRSVELVRGLQWLFQDTTHKNSIGEHVRRIIISGEGPSKQFNIKADFFYFSSFFPADDEAYVIDTDNIVEFASEETSNAAAITVQILKNPSFDEIGKIYHIYYKSNKHSFKAMFDDASRSGIKAEPLETPTSYFAPYGHRNQPMQIGFLSDAVTEGWKESVIDIMQQIDTNIHDIDITAPHPDFIPTVMVKTNQEGMIPLSVMGDGIRRALAFALAIPKAANGILLIDEIETALHVSALDKVFPWLANACREYNVQLFATTHSLEAISAITKAVVDSGEEDLAAHHLMQTDEGIRVKRYTTPMLDRVVRKGGLDIR